MVKAEIKNGTATITIPSTLTGEPLYTNGEHQITAEYIQNNQYKSSNTHATLTIKNPPRTIQEYLDIDRSEGYYSTNSENLDVTVIIPNLHVTSEEMLNLDEYIQRDEYNHIVITAADPDGLGNITGNPMIMIGRNSARVDTVLQLMNEVYEFDPPSEEDIVFIDSSTLNDALVLLDDVDGDSTVLSGSIVLEEDVLSRYGTGVLWMWSVSSTQTSTTSLYPDG